MKKLITILFVIISGLISAQTTGTVDTVITYYGGVIQNDSAIYRISYSITTTSPQQGSMMYEIKDTALTEAQKIQLMKNYLKTHL